MERVAKPLLPAPIALAIALAGALACAPGAKAPPSVLLVTVDTLRPDYLGANGYDRETSPALDALLESGFYFEQAVSPIARTTPALASLLAGAYPHTTGVRSLTDPLADAVATLPEVLRASGYRTLAVVTNQVLPRRRGLDRGFELYDMAPDHRRAGETTEAALGHLAAMAPTGLVFAWVHYIDPHVPYHATEELALAMDPGYEGPYRLSFGWSRQPGEPPHAHRTFPQDLPKGIATHRNRQPEAVNAHIRRLYAADIRYLDDAVARLLAGVRAALGGELLIVFAADHGESLGEHDFYFDHGDYVYNAGLRVPLAFVLPESHPLHGRGRCAGWVSLVDVAPTVVELLELAAPGWGGASHETSRARLASQMEGRSLTWCMRGGEPPDQEPVFAESGDSYYFEWVRRRQRNDVEGRFRAVIRGDWKLVWTPFLPDDQAFELYDLASDPHETRDLYRPDHPQVAGLRAALDAWLARPQTARTGAEPSPEDLEALRSLGYVE